MNRVWIKRKTTKRLFLAIPISPQWSDTLSLIQKEAMERHLAGPVPVHWTQQEQFHITVRFIGSVDEHCIPALIRTIRKLLDDTHRFGLPFESVHVATRDDPKMIWATYENVVPFRQLVVRNTARISAFLMDECNGLVMHNGHDVIPHVTLARLKGTLPAMTDFSDDISFPDMLPVDSLALYESKTLPSGSVYQKLATFRLKR